MHKVTPFLWFQDRAEEAANFYVSTFPNSRVLDVKRRSEAFGQPVGTPMVIMFELDGQQYTAFNGGPTFKLSPAVSLWVSCKDQAEVDHYWNRLLEGGGKESQCGWLEDRFGLSWQVVPDALLRYLGDESSAKVNRVAAAMFQMKKIVIADLDKAYAG